MPPPTPFESDPTLFALCLHLKETTSSSFLFSHFPFCLFHAPSISFFQTTFSLLIFSHLHGFFFLLHIYMAFLGPASPFFFFLVNVNRMVLALLVVTAYKDGFFFSPPSRTRLSREYMASSFCNISTLSIICIIVSFRFLTTLGG